MNTADDIKRAEFMNLLGEEARLRHVMRTYQQRKTDLIRKYCPVQVGQEYDFKVHDAYDRKIVVDQIDLVLNSTNDAQWLFKLRGKAVGKPAVNNGATTWRYIPVFPTDTTT